jgi:DNA polymerase
MKARVVTNCLLASGLHLLKAMEANEALTAQPFIPRRLTYSSLRDAAARCRGCNLYLNATQTVFGEGSLQAKILLVGEQPGDQEDLQGHPFVGPSGKILRRALEEAGIDAKKIYVTNAVKHFKHERLGKRRLHRRPNASEIRACRPWLETEVQFIRPEILICLGVTAAQSVLQKNIRLNQVRGKFLTTLLCEQTLVTTHPSALLRMPSAAAREKAYRLFVKELTFAKDGLQSAEKSAA